MNLPPLILASKSPRRKQILESAGFQVSIVTKEIDEDYPMELDVYSIPEFLAEKKAKEFIEESNNGIVITSDTIVILDGEVLGKPEDESSAVNMLAALSGKKHDVVTGVCLMFKGEIRCFSDITEVFFKELSKEEINYYVSEYQPLDKAGAYGIQEWIGMIGIHKIAGSYFNVMGLPIHKLYSELRKFL